MPGQTSQTNVLTKVAQRVQKMTRDARNEETTYDKGGDLPPDVRGTARITKLQIGTYGPDTRNPGEPYFYAEAAVILPKEFEGERTSIREDLFDTPNSKKKPKFDDHWAAVLLYLRRLGGDTSTFDKKNQVADAQALMDQLVEQEPCFRFRTWQGEATEAYPNPRVNHTWGRLTTAPEAGDAVTDGTNSGGNDSGEDIDALVEKANDNDADAQKTLVDLAVAATGQDRDEIEGLPDWETVAELARSGGGSGGSSDGDDLEALGSSADDDDDQSAKDRLEEIARENDIDPDDYGTYAELATALTEAGIGGSAEGEGEGGEEDLDAVGESADGGDDDATARLTELAEEHSLDPDDYGTWAELATAIGEAQGGGDSGDGEEDLDALGEQADEGDEDAQATLTAKGEEVGLDGDDYGTWAEFATAIGESNSSSGDLLPEVESLVNYKPKGKTKPVECEVTAVDEEKGTCTLLNNVDRKTKYTKVQFSELITE